MKSNKTYFLVLIKAKKLFTKNSQIFIENFVKFCKFFVNYFAKLLIEPFKPQKKKFKKNLCVSCSYKNIVQSTLLLMCEAFGALTFIF